MTAITNSKPEGKAKAAKPRRATRWAREDADVQLMLRVKEGERAAFEELVRRNTPDVHALVYRFLGSGERADDLTQEVFLRIYRNAHRYQPTAKFSTWLYRIVANLCFNVHRSRKNRHTVRLGFEDQEQGEVCSRGLEDERSWAVGRTWTAKSCRARSPRQWLDCPGTNGSPSS